MKKKQKKKYVSTYELMKRKYPYSFYDSICSGAKFSGTGLKEPRVAEDYVREFFNITKDLLEGNYKIINCLATFSDDDYGSYGEMELVKNGRWTDEGISKWNEYYLRGPGKDKRERCKDLIARCTLHMDLEHVPGRRYLSVDSYHITEERDKKKKKKRKFKLYHSLICGYDFKTKQFIKYNSGSWVSKKEMQMPLLQDLDKNKKTKKQPKYKATVDDIEKCRTEILDLLEKNKDKVPDYSKAKNIPRSTCFMYSYNENDKFVYIKPPSYLISEKQAHRAGMCVSDAPAIVRVDRDILADYNLYDPRTLKFRPISKSCNRDRLLESTKRMKSKIESSYTYDDKDFLESIFR